MSHPHLKLCITCFIGIREFWLRRVWKVVVVSMQCYPKFEVGYCNVPVSLETDILSHNNAKWETLTIETAGVLE